MRVSVDLTALAQALDSEQAHTSFGKLPLSVEKTAAQYSFTQANRWDGSKIFVNELTKNENIGKNAPGPQYMYDDKIKYGEVSASSAQSGRATTIPRPFSRSVIVNGRLGDAKARPLQLIK